MQRCSICRAEYPDDAEDCPYADGLPKSFNIDDIEFCRWQVHRTPACKNDQLSIRRARYVIDQQADGGPPNWWTQIKRRLPNPIRVVAVLMILASLYMTIISRQFRIDWLTFTRVLFIPVGLGLWFYKPWARWSAVTFYGAGLLMWVGTHYPQILKGEFQAIHFPAIAALILCYLLEWPVPKQSSD